MQKLLKRPEDYPIFTFRISAKDKGEIVRSINAVKKFQNKNASKHLKKTKKNEVIVQALKIGLEELKKRRENE